MTNPIIRYPLDITGINPDNFVNSEIHTTSNKPVRAIALSYGAFFTESVRVYDNRTDQLLVRGTQYLCTELLQAVSEEYGKEICFLIILIDPLVSPEVRVNYQALGGLYGRSTDAILNIYESLQTDARPVNWVNVLNRPLEYNPTPHLHDIRDVFGFQYLVTSLERVRNAIIISDVPAFEATLDWINNALISLANTQATDMALISEHAVDLTNPHQVTKAQVGLGNVQDLSVNIADDINNIFSLQNNSNELLIPTDKYVTLRKLLLFKTKTVGLIDAAVTSLLKTINSSGSTVLEVAAADATAKSNAAIIAAVAAAEMFSSNANNLTSGTVGTDRIPALDWTRITTGKPTSLAGYGITDGVSSTTFNLSQINRIRTDSVPYGTHGSIAVSGSTNDVAGVVFTDVGGVLMDTGTNMGYERYKNGIPFPLWTCDNSGNFSVSGSFYAPGSISTGGNLNVSAGSATVSGNITSTNGGLDVAKTITSSAGGLNVAGDITSSGGSITVAGDITAFSDERFKKNWRALPSDFVLNWSKVKHGIYDRTDTNLTQVGLSAQSVREVLPNTVIEREDGYLSLNYGAAAAVATVKLAERTIENTNDISLLVSVISKLELRIKELENK